MSASVRVLIYARILSGGRHGGIEQVVASLVHALGRLSDGQEEYIILSDRRDSNWLKPFVGPNTSLVVRQPAPILERARSIRRKPLYTAHRLWQHLCLHTIHRPLFATWLPESDGYYESLGADLVHFPIQSFARCNLPSIFNPYDLQHLHYPQFFSKVDFAIREIIYRAACATSRAVVVPSRWVKHDIVSQYHIDPNKVYVSYLAPAAGANSKLASADQSAPSPTIQLPETFAFYPAQTWPHKNHIRLLEALALVRDRDNLIVNLVCTGRKNAFWLTIERQITRLRLENQVQFLGFVQSNELQTIYRRARFVIHPSLFEGGGMPILEAFREGVPVACSSVTSLTEYAGNAALYFEPQSVESIATALERMMLDDTLRAELRTRGATQLGGFTWETAAKTYRALYRQVAGKVLADEDRDLLRMAS